MEIPDWLNQHYIEQALRKYYAKTSLKIIECQIKSALPKGENYGGILTRIHVIYELAEGSDKLDRYFIGKSSYESDEFAKEKMKPYDIFNREISIYEQVIPELENLLLEIKDEERIFVKTIHIDYEKQLLIFEDLSAEGYVMPDRLQGLDRNIVEIILRKLAKMHAASAVLNERKNKCLQKYDRGFFNRHTNCYSTYFLGNLAACAKCVDQWPEYKYYSNKLKDLQDNYMNIGVDCFNALESHINVLCHGDLWTNNVLCKYAKDTGKVLDVILIDFQYSVWAAPALDLHYFFNTSLEESLRLYKQEELLEFYYQIFRKILSQLQYKSHTIPSLHKFLLHVEQKKFMAFHSACVIQPVMINEDTKDADFNALMSEDERGRRFKETVYKNAKVQQNLKNLLPVFDQRGLLEINQCT